MDYLRSIFSPAPSTPQNKGKQELSTPGSPNGVSKQLVLGGKRKSLKRRNKKNNKTKRR